MSRWSAKTRSTSSPSALSPSWEGRPAANSLRPVTKLSSVTGSWPMPLSAEATGLPMYPAPPATKDLHVSGGRHNHLVRVV